MIFSVDAYDRQSSTIFQQYLSHNASIHIYLIGENSSSTNLQCDLWLPDNYGLLRTRLDRFPFHVWLFLIFTFDLSSSSSSIFLFGQLMDRTDHVIRIHSTASYLVSSPLLFQLGKYDTNLPSAHIRLRSMSWSWQPTSRR
jgi:hypothetical protein